MVDLVDDLRDILCLSATFADVPRPLTQKRRGAPTLFAGERECRQVSAGDPKTEAMSLAGAEACPNPAAALALRISGRGGVAPCKAS